MSRRLRLTGAILLVIALMVVGCREKIIPETPDYVEIRGRGLEMEGVGMVADFKTEVFRLLDNVRVRAVPGEISR